MADDKMLFLKHADQWKESDTSVVMTLKLQLEKQENKTSDLFQQLTAHLTKLTQSCHNNNTLPGPTRTSYLEWMITPPQHITEVSKFMNDKHYIWCTRCHSGKGLWVCTHNTQTHIDNYKCDCNHNQHRNPNLNHQLPQGHPRHFPTPPPSPVHLFNLVPPQRQAQLSLADYLDGFFDGTPNDDAKNRE